jgi:hypothetical protein
MAERSMNPSTQVVAAAHGSSVSGSGLNLPNQRYNHPSSLGGGQDSGTAFDVGACYGCDSFEHLAGDCPAKIRCVRCGQEGHGSRLCPEKKPWEFVAPMCGAQSEEQAFFFIENIPNVVAIKERASLAMIIVVKGVPLCSKLNRNFKIYLVLHGYVMLNNGQNPNLV